MSTVVSYMPGVDSAESEIKRVFDCQRATALRLRSSSAKERLAKLKRLREALISHWDDIRDAGYRDFKKLPFEVDLGEMLTMLGEVNTAIRHLKKWMKPRRVRPNLMMFGVRGWIQHEPRGRCLIISPWNYPATLTLEPLISAIAAGNTAILKPSEMTPSMTGVLIKIVRELFPEDEVAVIEGDAAVSTALLALPFDHIFFTGAPAIGKVVMAAAARHLTSITLELGGKSPTIVDESADLDLAARTIIWFKFVNNGQSCTAPDHVYVHASVRDRFVTRCQEIIAQSYGVTPNEQMARIARIVNQRHTRRVADLLDDAQQRGARVLTGGKVSESDSFVSPTLIDNVPADARIQSEEIFGPLLPIATYTNLDEVIARINEQPKPLGLYIWSRTEANINRVLKGTSSGGICINHVGVQFGHGNLPFGGIGNSGIGNSHGFYGFRAFSHERAVLRTWVMVLRLIFPPHSSFTTKLLGRIKLLARYV